MIPKFVECWESKKHLLRENFTKKEPSDYKELVKEVVKLLEMHTAKSWNQPDSSDIQEVTFGQWNGVLLYLIPERTPSGNFWYVSINYGSCSSCDTFGSCYGVEDYMILALHVVQGLKRINGEAIE